MSDAEKRVVVGVDGSPVARRALEVAAREASLRGARLEVVGVWAFPVYVDFVGGVYPLPGEVGTTIEREEELLAGEVSAVLGPLPATGSRTRGPLTLGLVFLGLGAAMVLVARKPRALS